MGDVRRFQSKPVQIEAFQWNGERDLPAPFDGARISYLEAGLVDDPRPYLAIVLPSGHVGHAFPGDWIIKGIDGYSSCKPSDFTEAYEPSHTSPPVSSHAPSAVQAWPENYWREVWHLHCPKRGPMKRQPETMTIEDGSVLDRYECLACGATCFAGLDKSWRIINRPVPPEPVHV